jgi:hypothetical protein
VSPLAGVIVVYFSQMNRVLTHLAEEDLETVKGLLNFRADGRMDFQESHHHAEWRQMQERQLLEVRAPDGRVLYGNERLSARSIGGPPFPGDGEPILGTLDKDVGWNRRGVGQQLCADFIGRRSFHWVSAQS